MSRLVFWVKRQGVRILGHLLLLAVILPGEHRAVAGTAAGPAPLRTVSRPLDPGRAHADLELGYEYRSSSDVFGADGLPQASEPSARWTVHQLALRGVYGLSPRVALFFDLPLLYPTLSNEGLEPPLHNDSLLPGDITLGMRWRVVEKARPYAGLTLELHGVAPTGLEASGDRGTGLLTGTGVPELGAGLSLRRQLGRFALSLSGSYTARMSQVVAYAEAVYPDGSRGDARLHPGNQTDTRLAVELEPFARLWLEAAVHGAWQQTYGLGTTERWLFPSLDLEPIPGSEGLLADAGLTIAVRISERLEVAILGRYRFYGRALPEFAALGLETFSPAPGPSGGLSLRMHL